MDRLKYSVRNKKIKYDTRAICYIENILELFNRAIEEEIKKYIIVFAYDERLYKIGFQNTNGLVFLLEANGNTLSYNTIYELRSNLSFNHNVTVLREYQYEDINTPIVVDIKDNYMLGAYLVTSDIDTFNYNLSTELINEYNNLMMKAKKEKIPTVIIIVGTLLLLLIIISISIIINK